MTDMTRGTIVTRANGRGRGVVIYTNIYGQPDLITVRWTASTTGLYQGADLEWTNAVRVAADQVADRVHLLC